MAHKGTNMSYKFMIKHQKMPPQSESNTDIMFATLHFDYALVALEEPYSQSQTCLLSL